MSATPTVQQLAELDDETLARLAREWRAAAGRGDKRAFGTAHALEVERRRRLRDSELARLEPMEDLAGPRPWWKFWG
ncbi:MAG: hypothetical protein ABWZ88_02595 [Variovorax sp.]